MAEKKRRMAKRKQGKRQPGRSNPVNALLFKMLSRGYGMGYNGAPVANQVTQSSINSQLESLKDELQRGIKDTKELSQVKADVSNLVASQRSQRDLKRLEDQMKMLTAEGVRLDERLKLAMNTDPARQVVGRPPLSAEVKAERAAQAQAEKERKAAEKEAEKQRKAAEKAEKAAEKQSKRGGRGRGAQLSPAPPLNAP